MKKHKTSQEDNTKKFTKKDVKYFVINILFGVFTTFILAVLDLLCDVSAYSGAKQFFTAEVFTNVAINFGINVFMMAMLFAYASYVKKGSLKEKRIIPLICVSMLITYVIGILIGQYVNLYVVPITLGALVVATLVDRRLGAVVNVITATMYSVTFILFFKDGSVGESIATLITSIVSGTLMILCIIKCKSRSRFLLAGLGIGFLCAFIPVLSEVMFGEVAIAKLAMTFMWSFLSVVVTLGLYMLALPLLESLFHVNTIYTISELCSLNSPLLQRLAKEAPGTFNHSLLVGNLAEQCALKIGENPTLAKACAYYHDVGKLQKPEYFVENQHGENVHDELIPEVSVKIITSHTSDGYKILKEYNMPEEIASVAREHHGTTPVKYFYYKAQNVTEDVLESSEFSYDDPKPSTKIAAIVMIVDTVEAAVRAAGLKTGYKEFIHKIIKEKEDLNQFTNCPLTFADLQKIEDVLVESVPYLSHSRIKYDNKK